MLSPPAALLFLTGGAASLAVEAFRPGWILPGVLGLCGMCLGLHGIADNTARALMLCSAIAFGFELLRTVRLAAAALGAAAFVAAATRLPGVNLAFALSLGILLGSGIAFLALGTASARRNKTADL